MFDALSLRIQSHALSCYIMQSMFSRKSTTLTSLLNSHLFTRLRNLSSRASTILEKKNEPTHQSLLVDDRETKSPKFSSGIHLSPLFSHGNAHSDEYKIEVVDAEAWRVSSGLAQVWRGTDAALERQFSFTEAVDEAVNDCPLVENDLDFDEIEDMRVRGNLFYKLDRDSKEFEEYNFDFHRRRSSKRKDDRKLSKKKEHPSRELGFGGEELSKMAKKVHEKDDRKISEKKKSLNCELVSKFEELPSVAKKKNVVLPVGEMENCCVERKKLRTPTFNQLTGPYHEPFCLDIYISKSSVRACIVHRVTSKVVAVAHSISKDMKFDLASTRNAAACAAVGGILAQRSLADDIHDVIYTPRKGERLEGKLQIVLQSVIGNGVNVKVKIKQRKPKKAGHSSNA